MNQRSMVGAAAREMYDQQAKERMKKAGEKGGTTTAAKRRGEDKGKKKSSDPTPKESGQSRDKCGEAVGVSGFTIDQATKEPPPMSGTVHIPDDPDPGSWKAHERDGSIALQISDADGRQVAELVLDPADIVNMLIAVDVAEEHRTTKPAA